MKATNRLTRQICSSAMQESSCSIHPNIADLNAAPLPRKQYFRARLLAFFIVIVCLPWALFSGDNDLTITKVTVDAAMNCLVIEGMNFTDKYHLVPSVVLNQTQLNLASEATSAKIVAVLPAGLPPGTYLLHVSQRNYWKSNNGDTFYVALGAVGPTGPQGPQGIQGLMGPQGIQGLKGDTGAAGPAGSNGPKGDTGAAGSQGPKGDQGEQGPAGSFPSGNAVGDMQYWDGTQWIMVPGGTNGQILTFSEGKPMWKTGAGNDANINLAYPDGLTFDEPILLPQFTNYTVPTGKNLYILNLYPGNITIDGIPFTGYSIAGTGKCFIVGENMTISTTNNPTSMFGLLVNKKVSFIAHDLNSSNYTVPDGKVLIVNSFKDNQYIDLFLNGTKFLSVNLATEGQTISGGNSFVGYLIDK
jgi:hypothetical protein